MRIFWDDSEKRLADDVRKGNHTAMKKLYDTWSGYLFALCRRYVPDRENAEDILQEVFIKIFASMDSFSYKGPGSLKAWMSRIAVNESLMYLRKKKKTDFVEYQDNLPDHENEEEPDVGRVPVDVIQRMIGELPDGYRTVFNLFVFEDKSHKEIAGLLGITESTSASQFHRARKILAGKIKEYETKHG